MAMFNSYVSHYQRVFHIPHSEQGACCTSLFIGAPEPGRRKLNAPLAVSEDFWPLPKTYPQGTAIEK